MGGSAVYEPRREPAGAVFSILIPVSGDQFFPISR